MAEIDRFFTLSKMSVIGSDAAETARKMYGLPPAGQSSGGGGGGGGGAVGGRMSGRIRTARHVADMPGSGRPTAPSFDDASDAGNVPDDAVSQASSHNPWKVMRYKHCIEHHPLLPPACSIAHTFGPRAC